MRTKTLKRICEDATNLHLRSHILHGRVRSECFTFVQQRLNHVHRRGCLLVVFVIIIVSILTIVFFIVGGIELFVDLSWECNSRR